MRKVWWFIKKAWISAFKWVKRELKDKVLRRIFYVVFLVMSAPVWLFYTLGIIFKNGWFVGVASGYLFFWNVVPATPFLGICLGITIGIRMTWNKIFNRKMYYRRLIYNKLKVEVRV